MNGRNLVIISFTAQGCCLNAGLNRQLSRRGYVCESYAPGRSADRYGFSKIPADKKAWIGRLWGRTAFVFIGAAGIAVRYIAAWAEDKYKDSAVLVLDEKGKFVIPILSGHMGGGVELAEEIAACTGAEAVITTATDVQNRFAVDVFARKNQLHIGSRNLAKQISAAVLEGKKAGFYSAYPVRGDLPSDLSLCHSVSDLKQSAYGIAVSQQEPQLQEETGPVLHLMPKDLAVGIGCRRGVPFSQIQQAVQSVFSENGWKTERICALASIDLKQQEAGILELAKMYGIPFYTFSAARLWEAGPAGSSSAFVQSVTGVDNVCERAAKCCCQNGTLLLPKVKMKQVTVSVVQRKVELEF